MEQFNNHFPSYFKFLKQSNFSKEIAKIKDFTNGSDLIIVALGETHKDLKSILLECPDINIIVKPSKFGVYTNNPQLTSITQDVILGKYPLIKEGYSYKERYLMYVLTTYDISMYIGVANILVRNLDEFTACKGIVMNIQKMKFTYMLAFSAKPLLHMIP